MKQHAAQTFFVTTPIDIIYPVKKCNIQLCATQVFSLPMMCLPFFYTHTSQLLFSTTTTTYYYFQMKNNSFLVNIHQTYTRVHPFNPWSSTLYMSFFLMVSDAPTTRMCIYLLYSLVYKATPFICHRMMHRMRIVMRHYIVERALKRLCHNRCWIDSKNSKNNEMKAKKRRRKLSTLQMLFVSKNPIKNQGMI